VYEVLLERSAERDLKRLPPDAYARIVPHLKALAQNSRPVGCRKLISSAHDWRIRVGDYRIVYEIDDGQRIVRINRVRHRRDVYR
jgi:mRNA interferase RelE/StbE